MRFERREGLDERDERDELRLVGIGFLPLMSRAAIRTEGARLASPFKLQLLATL